MKQTLSDLDRDRLDRLIAEVEKRTKTQIVLAVVKRSDAHAEIPWKAFSLGASAAGLTVFILYLLRNPWPSQSTLLITIAAVLVAGAAFAVLTVLAPAFARLFLSGHRAELEARQYAESLFLSRELFATRGRTGILLFVGLFERKVVLLPDKGLASRLTGEAMRDVIARMVRPLRRKKTARALESGLERLSQILEASAPAGPAENELPDTIIEEKGE
jgi:putative membrane protein